MKCHCALFQRQKSMLISLLICLSPDSFLSTCFHLSPIYSLRPHLNWERVLSTTFYFYFCMLSLLEIKTRRVLDGIVYIFQYFVLTFMLMCYYLSLYAIWYGKKQKSFIIFVKVTGLIFLGIPDIIGGVQT